MEKPNEVERVEPVRLQLYASAKVALCMAEERLAKAREAHVAAQGAASHILSEIWKHHDLKADDGFSESTGLIARKSAPPA